MRRSKTKMKGSRMAIRYRKRPPEIRIACKGDRQKGKREEPRDYPVDYLYKLAEQSYQTEVDRYASLLETSNRLLTSESIFIAALALVVPYLADAFPHEGPYLAVSFCIVFVFTSISFALCLMSQWRFKIKALASPGDMADFIDKNLDKLRTREDAARSYCESIQEPFQSLVERNDKISRLLKASLVALIIALVAFVAVLFIGVLLLSIVALSLHL